MNYSVARVRGEKLYSFTKKSCKYFNRHSDEEYLRLATRFGCLTG